MADPQPSPINRRSPVPLFFQVAEQLQERLLTGSYKAGQPFITVRETVSEFGISFVTAQRALAHLAKEGWVISQRGRGGTIVKRTSPKRTAVRSRPALPDTRRIVVLWPTHHSVTPTFQALFAPVLQGLRSALPGYNVALEFPDEATLEDNHQAYLNRLLETNSHAGFCLATCPAYIKRYFAVRRLPTVVIGNLEAGIELSCVRSDEQNAMYELTRHVIELGHRRVVMAFGKPRVAGHEDRIRGYRKALLDAGPLSANWQARCELAVRFQRDTATRQFQLLLSEPGAPTAALCTGPVIASWFKSVAGPHFHTAYDVHSEMHAQLPGSSTVMFWPGEKAGLLTGELLRKQLDGDATITHCTMQYEALRDFGL